MHQRKGTVRNSLFACIMLIGTILPIGAASTGSVPTDSEVKIAIQAVLVAYAATQVGKNLDPPIYFEESIYSSDRSQSSISLRLENADIGRLRQTVLESPNPVQQQSTGFLDMLFRAALPLTPSHESLVAYLVPQALKAGEVVFDGEVSVDRTAATYPFRYEGIGSLKVAGRRFKQPFTLDFTFRIPLEGPQTATMVPVQVSANGADYLHVALQLFPQRLGPRVSN